LAILSDGAPQFDVLVHASCWIDAERPLARVVPYSDEHRTAIEKARQQIWDLYQDLKTYRQKPEESQKPVLEAAFDALCGKRTGFPSIDGVFKEMKDHRADLLRVLERPEIPLHNNLSEGHVRDYVKKRKISGSTRSPSGRRARDPFASLKKTCRRLGVNFWAYLQDRVRGLGRIAPLATLIRQRGEELLARTERALPKGAEDGVVV
ncbi:MAG: transposase, partial [Isosphaeraceae bacterium]